MTDCRRDLLGDFRSYGPAVDLKQLGGSLIGLTRGQPDLDGRSHRRPPLLLKSVVVVWQTSSGRNERMKV